MDKTKHSVCNISKFKSEICNILPSIVSYSHKAQISKTNATQFAIARGRFRGKKICGGRAFQKKLKRTLKSLNENNKIPW